MLEPTITTSRQLGPVAWVHGRMRVRKPQPAPLDSVAALLEFAGGATGVLATVRATPLYWRLHVFGSRGSAEALGETELLLRLTGQGVQRPQLQPVDGLRFVLEAFADAVEGRAPYPMPQAEMLATVAAFEATLESIRQGRPMQVQA